MKKALGAAGVAAVLATASAAWATPSTTFWTPATTYTQPLGLPHLTYDTYFAERGNLQIDTGLTVGVLALKYVQAEVGIDLFYPGFTKDFTQLNAKVTLPEGALGAWAPGLSIGLMNVGFQKDVSDYNCVHATLGKTTPYGILGAGAYYGAGSKALWTGTDGEARTGFMASYVTPDIATHLPGLDKVVFLADLATGKNWLGAAGAGVGLYFTPAIALLTGPVFFLDRDYYKSVYGTDWMWTFQLDVDMAFGKK